MIGFDNCQGFFMVADFSERLRFFRSQRGLSQQELANAVGISRKQISDYEVGTAKPRQATYMKILKALDISDQIFSKSDLCSLDINDLDGDQVISFSNSDGDKIMLSKSFCTKNHLNEVDILSVFKIKGDAMQETLFNDDLVLVDTSDKYFISGLIYLIYFYGERMVVRLHRSANGLIEITKDNSAYPDNTVNESEIIVLGKVVYRQGLI
ncbi:LexA family transcriptional regulator [uncultured Acinetobacter sp.]|uniref:LexA family transcriptional regulator n=2 Tax=Acinetobacter TaxID=469 RepID=UPI000DD03444|nr:LexA family transcriptional regulator [uncultured Acinetobacter sp.]